MSSKYGMSETDYYTILNLPTILDTSSLTKDKLKAAYHAALLRNHPDKTAQASVSRRQPPRSNHGESYTVDQIFEAYRALSDPVTRAAYDKILERRGAFGASHQKEANLHRGVEVHDLEDMTFDEKASVWFRGCRCGEDRGYVLRETELEAESSAGQVLVPCTGCSLWITVLFSVVDATSENIDDRPRDGSQMLDSTRG